jgi:hypothetical protein
MNRGLLSDVVSYSECRIREALLAIKTAIPQNRTWMEKALYKELVGTLSTDSFMIDCGKLQRFVLMYIGMAAACGCPANIPFIIALLSRDLNLLEFEDTGIVFSQEMNDLLDAGPFCAMPTSYLEPWWLGNVAPGPNGIFGATTFDRLMRHYYADEEKYTWLLHRPHRCPLASGWTNEAEQTLLGMPHCIRQQIVQAESDVQEKMMLSERRAAGFYQLWEAALDKEVAGGSFAAATPALPSAAVPAHVGTSSTAESQGNANRRLRSAAKRKHSRIATIPDPLTKGQLAEIFRTHSARELCRLQQNPAIKWRWGADLTEADISTIVRAADNNFQIPNSDYDMSLPMGDTENTGEDSTNSGRFNSEDSLSEAAISQPKIPFLAPDDFPTHFSTFPLRRPRSAVPEGLLEQQSALDVQSVMDDLELLELATAALDPEIPVEAPADNAAAASLLTSQHDQRAQSPIGPQIEDSEMLDLAAAALQGWDSQAGTNAKRAAVEFPAPCLNPTVGICGNPQTKAAVPFYGEGTNRDVESELLALANTALYPNPIEDSSAAQQLTADPSFKPSSPTNDLLDAKAQEMLDLADLVLQSFPEPAESPVADIELADDEMAILDEFELESSEGHDSTHGISGPWTADHFPRAPSDTEPESDEEY